MFMDMIVIGYQSLILQLINWMITITIFRHVKFAYHRQHLNHPVNQSQNQTLIAYNNHVCEHVSDNFTQTLCAQKQLW